MKLICWREGHFRLLFLVVSLCDGSSSFVSEACVEVAGWESSEAGGEAEFASEEGKRESMLYTQ